MDTMGLGRVASSALCLLALLCAAPRPAIAGGVYFVKEGDTLIGISRLFGVGISELRDANRISGATIMPGDRIRIPDRAPASPGSQGAARVPELQSERVSRVVCREETVYHNVAAGDTLTALARRYKTAVGDLLELNGLRKSSRLAIGRKLLVRRTGPRSHTVARGETLHGIATRYQVQPLELARLNSIQGRIIHPGQRLQIEPCDPYAAGNAIPPLDSPSTPEREAFAGAAGETETARRPTAVQRVIDLATTMLNIPYRFGGTTLRGIDCSAFVQRVFGLLDVRLPRTAREQYRVGADIARADLAVGDLVFFRTYASFPSHVGIYLGDDLFIHASSVVRRVTIDSIDQPYYRRRFIGARRLVDGDSLSLASTP